MSGGAGLRHIRPPRPSGSRVGGRTSARLTVPRGADGCFGCSFPPPARASSSPAPPIARRRGDPAGARPRFGLR
eukprot:11175895-Lingulodinium_polyedra.AAC.1